MDDKKISELSAPTTLTGAEMFPIAQGGETVAALISQVMPLFQMTASETIAAGNFVNIHANSGAKVRKANATDATKPVNGWAPAGIASAASGTIQGPGTLITGLSGLTPGVPYYLSTTGGGLIATPPSSSGNLVQHVGVALSATALFFYPQQGTEL